jgi:peptidoglycan hydrolase-like protein with peptidoglycan-binding domain
MTMPYNNIKKLNVLVSLFVTAVMISSIFVTSTAQNNSNLRFDRNYVISNATFTSYRDFPSSASVQKYLESKNSILKNYRDNNMLASDIIFKAASGDFPDKYGTKPRISPALMLTMLEKEQSLVSTTTYDTVKDPEKKLSYAMGYGCPDTTGCNQEYKGFYNQVTWGAFQLQYNYDNAYNTKFSPYNVGSSFLTGDNNTVTIENEATASLYRYTPHVFWGNYNVFKIMLKNQWTVNKINTTYDAIDAVNQDQFNTNNCDGVFNLKYKIGMENENVLRLQKCLQKEGLFDFPVVTGYFGYVTNNGLMIYLTRNNSCSRFLYKTYRIGHISQEVTDLQNCLMKEGLFPLTYTTGYYGPITNEALRKYKM